MTAGVYLLRDPTNGIVRYVGKSKNIEQRYKQHCMSRASNQRLSKWIEELHHLGMRPVIGILEVPVEALDQVENMYIRRHFATVFNGHHDGQFRVYSEDASYNPPKVSARCLFYRERDAYAIRLINRAVRFGHRKYKLHQGANVRNRASLFALNSLQNHPETSEFFKQCWLENGYLLTTAYMGSLEERNFADERVRPGFR